MFLGRKRYDNGIEGVRGVVRRLRVVVIEDRPYRKSGRSSVRLVRCICRGNSNLQLIRRVIC
jgi:hypothetical protein